MLTKQIRQISVTCSQPESNNLISITRSLNRNVIIIIWGIEVYLHNGKFVCVWVNGSVSNISGRTGKFSPLFVLVKKKKDTCEYSFSALINTLRMEYWCWRWTFYDFEYTINSKDARKKKILYFGGNGRFLNRSVQLTQQL